MANNKSSLQGYLLVFISTIIYGLYGVFTKIINGYFQSFTTSFIRESITIFLSLLLIIFGIIKWQKIQKADFKWFIVMGLISTMGNFALYNAYSLLPVGIASFLSYSLTIIGSAIFGIIFFKERIDKLGVFAIILAISGVLLTSLGSLGTFNVLGALFSIGFGLCISLFAVLSKKFSGQYDSVQIYMIVCIIVAPLSFILSMIFRENIPAFEFNSSWLWIFIFAVMALLANMLYIKGFRYNINVSIAGIICTTESVVAVIAGYLIYSEVLSPITLIGCILIIVAAVLPHFPTLLKNK